MSESTGRTTEDDKDCPLEIHDLTVAYQKRPVLWGVDVKIPKGQLIGIIGPNGAGKSTLIKAIMGLVPVSGGWIKVFGRPAKHKIKPGGVLKRLVRDR